MESETDVLCKQLITQLISDSVLYKLSLSETAEKFFGIYSETLGRIWEIADPNDKIPFTIVEMLLFWATEQDAKNFPTNADLET
jgi:hypothetical protein